jgi:hypothetical protein
VDLLRSGRRGGRLDTHLDMDPGPVPAQPADSPAIPTLRFTRQHEATDECVSWHCFAHGVDEVGRHTFRTCGECGHVYRSRFAMLNTYRRVMLADWRYSSHRPTLRKQTLTEWMGEPCEPIPFGSTIWQWLRRFLFTSDLDFCPECAHDF